MCAPFCRQRESLTVTTLPSVVASASPALRERLGFRCWQNYGRIGWNFNLSGDPQLVGLPRMSMEGSTALSETDRMAAGVQAAEEEPTEMPQVLSDPPRSGLFLDSYSQLPEPTADSAQWRHDLDTYGYCMLEQALNPEQTRKLALRTVDQAAAELQHNVAHNHGAGQQRLWSVLNKGDEFVDLLGHEDANSMIQHLLGDEMQVSTVTATITKPGCPDMNLHTDQWWAPPPMRVSDRAPRLRPGSVTRALAYSGDWDSASDEFVTPCLAINVIWCVSDFTTSNGACGLNAPLVLDDSSQSSKVGSVGAGRTLSLVAI